MVRFADFGRFDPLPTFRFIVRMAGVTVGHFSEVTGLRMETDSIEYREGGEPAIIRQIPGLTRSGDITLRRGLSRDQTLELWYAQIFDLTGVTNLPPDPAFRRPLTIDVIKRGGVIAKSYTIFRCWPKSYTPGDFQAMESALAIEEVVLGNEGFKSTQIGGAVLSPPNLF